MELLSTLELTEDRPRRKGKSSATIRDPRSSQTLVVESDEPLQAYSLEATGWGPGEKHPDGLLIGALDGEPVVCFVELKGRLKPADASDTTASQRVFEQLSGAVTHFHPAEDGTGHGALHHEQWKSGHDLLPVHPTVNHRVWGVAVAFRNVARPAPLSTLRMRGTEVSLRAVQLSQTRPNTVEVTFRELLERAGFLSS